MTFHVLPQNQGQIVEIAYARAGDTVVCRTLDRSDRSERYEVATALAGDEGDYWNQEPANRRWKTVSKEYIDRLSG